MLSLIHDDMAKSYFLKYPTFPISNSDLTYIQLSPSLSLRQVNI